MSYVCLTGNGEKADASHAIFPILKKLEEKWYIIGTAFFISTTGLFVTAKHVLEDVFDKQGIPTCPLYGFQIFDNNKYIIRPILRSCQNKVSDVAVGVLAPVTHNKTGEQLYNKVLTLTTVSPKIDSRIVTYAYPKSTVGIKGQVQTITLKTDFYDGKLEEYYPNGRDSAVMPFPCYRGSIEILGGASGGPAMDEEGRVFGVNCTGFDENKIGFFARINEILALSVDNVNVNGAYHKRIGVINLVEDNKVLFDPPINRNNVTRRD